MNVRAIAMLLSVLLLSPAVPAAAQTLILSDFLVDNEAGEITARFSLDLRDQDQVELMLKEGASLALECTATLYERRGYWTDRKISSTRYTSQLQLDTLTKEYALSRPGGGKSARDRDLSSLIDFGWSRIGMELGGFAGLERGNTYYVELDVRLRQLDVPDWMKNVLFFKSWEAAPAATYQMEFEY